jgi:hypothetical protein
MNHHATKAPSAVAGLLTCYLVALACGVQGQPGTSLFTIPVVFHVLHQNGTENISDAQIADAMTILNAHFDAPTETVEPPFDAIAADMDIAFVLATTAPDGSSTTGIERMETPLTIDAGAPSTYLNAWPRNRYLNIWIVHSLATPGIAFISHLPEQADTEPCMDGVMIYYSYVGAIGTSSVGRKRTLTQAIGRFLNLKRVHEDPIDGGPCADDDVEDTPPALPNLWCNGAMNPCASIVANEHNFMSSPYCSNMFTLGQRERVHACLSNTIAQRNELASGSATTSPDCSTTAIQNPTAIHGTLRVYPSPASDALTFELGMSHAIPGTYQVLTGQGTLVLEGSVTGTSRTIAIDALAPGHYLLRCTDTGGLPYLARFSVVR